LAHENPYKEEAMKQQLFLVRFQRIGALHHYRGYTRLLEAESMAALEAPVTEILNDIFEEELHTPPANVQVTIIDDKGQINYGLLGEFTITPT
jgi:hypothetical protein